jgi:formamidopyrimidine-DNA glycosylase
MPELAEVDLARRLWDAGLGERVLEVIVPKPGARVFRGTDVEALRSGLTRQPLAESEASGKQMVFRFGAKRDRWLGIHLGMEGDLRVEPTGFEPRKHDYLILRQAKRALVFHDTRLFGRVLFHQGADVPEWWAKLPPSIFSEAFTREAVAAFLARRKRTALKPVLLMQERFPGVGNWMADEILWRARILPSKRAGRLNAEERDQLFRATKFVARESLRIVGPHDSKLPRSWLIHERWSAGGKCPRHKTLLRRATIGGRTTAWCPRCQR